MSLNGVRVFVQDPGRREEPQGKYAGRTGRKGALRRGLCLGSAVLSGGVKRDVLARSLPVLAHPSPDPTASSDKRPAANSLLRLRIDGQDPDGWPG